MKNFLLSAAIAATLISSTAFADSGNKLSAFDGIPSEAVQAKELDAVSGQGYSTIYKGQVISSSNLDSLKRMIGNDQAALSKIYGTNANGKNFAVDTALVAPTSKLVPAQNYKAPVTPAKVGTCNGCTVTTGLGKTIPSTTALKTIFGYK